MVPIDIGDMIIKQSSGGNSTDILLGSEKGKHMKLIFRSDHILLLHKDEDTLKNCNVKMQKFMHHDI